MTSPRFDLATVVGPLLAIATSTLPACAQGVPADSGPSATAESFVEQPPCIQPPPGLVSWWPGEGTAEDVSGGYHGSEVGSVTYVQGKVNRAFSLDGSGTYVEVLAEEPFDFGSGPFSILAWVKTPGHRSFNEHIFSKGYVWDGGDDYVLWVGGIVGGETPGVIDFQYAWPGIDVDLIGVTPIDDDQWHHVAVTQSGACAGCSKLYIDGVLDGTQDGKTLVNGSGPVFIGADIPTWNGPFSFRGLIDEVQVFDRELAPAEVEAIVEAGSAGLCRFVPITIDIKPGSYPNSVNPRSRGTLPVAILTTDTFDASVVVASTVRFGISGTEAEPHHWSLEDVDGDGDNDMIIHFWTQDTGLTCSTTVAALTGTTSSGQAIGGEDSVRVVGCRG